MRRRSGVGLCLIAVGTVSSLGYALNFKLAPLVDRLGLTLRAGEPLAAYPLMHLTLFALYGAAGAAVLRKRHGPSHLGLVLGFALLFRIALLFSPPVLSSDLYRYLWDGRVQTAGINPYLYPPSAAELASLRDEQIFPRINRPEAPTVYPPGAQMLFAAIATLFADSVLAMKGLMLLCDLGTMGLLVRLLKKRGIDPDRVLLYAWSPLVLFELAGSGHLEAVMLPFVLLALLARMGGRSVLAGAALGTATLIKLYPVALFPVLSQRRDRAFPLTFGATVVLGYIPYLRGARARVLGFLPAYFGPWEDFNVGLRDLLVYILTPVTVSPRLIAVLLVTSLLAAVAVYLSRERRGDDFLWRATQMVSAYLLLLPTSLHPWYVIWILPFLCFTPLWGWLYLSGALSLSYLKYVQDPQMLPLWVRLLEFLPLYALLGIQAARHRRLATEPAKTVTPLMEKSG